MLGASYFRVIGAGQVYGLSPAAWQLIPPCHRVKNFRASKVLDRASKTD